MTEQGAAKREFLRHTLATLAYRGGKVLRDAPPEFGAFRHSEASRSASEILAHIGDLLDWACSIVEGAQAWRAEPPGSFEHDAARFFAGLERLDARVAAADEEALPAERLFQGPVADALTHVGQIATLRRLAGAPVKGENYFGAAIAAGRVGRDQEAPAFEF